MTDIKNITISFIKTLGILLLLIIIPHYIINFNYYSKTTMPSTTMPSTTMPSTTMPPTTMPLTTMPPTTMPPTTMPPTIPSNTKQIYNKFEDIELPSSLVKETGGYISKDNVCFRDNINNVEFTNKRDKCMACQVDLRKDKNQNYENTNTNIIATCPYTTSDYLGVYKEDDCDKICKDIADLNDDVTSTPVNPI